MKKLISLTLTLTLIISLIVALPAMAAVNQYDTESDIVSIDMDFGDSSADVGCGYPSAGAAIETTTDALGQETKALALKYDGSSAYRKENSDSTLNSSWQLNENNKTVSISGKEAIIGFDFKIDSEGTAAGTYASRSNPGAPTLLHFFAPDANGSNKQTTYLVSAQYAGARGDDYANGPKKWNLCFSDGRKNYITSGHQMEVDKWVSVDVAIHLETGTYDAYVNGELVLEGLSLGGITNSTVIPNTGNITNVNMYGTNDGHYSVDNYSKWKVYIDNFRMQESEIKINETALVDGEGNKVTPEIRDCLAPDTFVMKLNKEPASLDLELNGVSIPAENIIKSVGTDGEIIYTYIPDTPFEWETEYTVTGKMGYSWYFIPVPEFKFTIGSQPDKLIELVGFYNQNGEKLSALESGTITAKLRFWQKTKPADYTYMLLLTTTDNPQKLPMMVGLTAKEVSAGAEDGYDAKGYTEETIEITVGSQYSDYTLKLLTWDDLIESRTPYTDNYFYGSRVITTPQTTE